MSSAAEWQDVMSIVGEVVLSLKIQACIREWWWKRRTSISKSFCKAIVCAISLNFVTPGIERNCNWNRKRTTRKKDKYHLQRLLMYTMKLLSLGSHLYFEKIAWRRGRGSCCCCDRCSRPGNIPFKFCVRRERLCIKLFYYHHWQSNGKRWWILVVLACEG